MTRDFSRLTSRRHDVLVIGGGIHGLAVAYDAAQRGLSVALVERGDFGSASSFNHAKTVHGGLRSLQSGDVLKARFSIRERRAMARIAPPLLTPLPFVIETTRKLTRSRLALRAGFMFDACLGLDRHAGLDSSLHLPAGEIISREDCERLFGTSRPGATGGARWFDYHMAETDRLTFAFALAADNHGAALLNYVEAIRPIKEGGRLSGFEVRDVLSGQRAEVAARIVVNASGSRVGTVMDAIGAPHDTPLLKAMNLVTSRPAGGTATGSPTRDGRLLLIMPWRGRALVGTSHSDQPVGPDDSSVSVQELDRFVGEVNEAFPALQLTRGDVTLVHRGVVPAERATGGAWGLKRHHRVIDHRGDGVDGAISIVGVKYTTARGVAEQAVDLACRRLGHSSASRTGTTPLPGCDIASVEIGFSEFRSQHPDLLDDSLARRLVETHGSLWTGPMGLCKADRGLAEPIAPACSTLRATVVHAARNEMAVTLTDVLVRRTGLGAAGYPGEAIVAGCSELMARECGWDRAREAAERDALLRFYAPVEPTRS